MSETQQEAAAPEAGANPLLKPWQTPPTTLSAPQVNEVKVNNGAAQRSRVTSVSVRFAGCRKGWDWSSAIKLFLTRR